MKRPNILSGSLFVFLCIGMSLAEARVQLSEVEIYERCYRRLVRSTPKKEDVIMVKVVAGETSGAQGCMQLLDLAKFGTNGAIPNQQDAVAKSVVRTMHDFHGSWFQSRIPSVGVGQPSLTSGLVIDLEEPSLFITRALFGGKRYDSIVRDSQALHGIRSRGSKANLTPYEAQRLIKYPTGAALQHLSGVRDLLIAHFQIGGAPQVALKVPNENIVQTGDLVGVKTAVNFVVPAVRILSRHGLTLPDWESAVHNVVVNKNFGGGILGSQVFMMENANLDQNVVANGDSSINRVIASRAFEDLLCHHLPTLTIADIEQEMNELVRPESEHMFRRDKSCMQCHAQIDYFAYGYRNLALARSGDLLTETSRNLVGLPMQSYVQFPLRSNGVYIQSTPEATLRFREFRSTSPTRLKVTGLAAMGQGLAASRDLYECAAKRYYKFFTGVDVPLDSLSKPPGSAEKSHQLKYELDSFHQDQVISLAKELRTHQSLRTLIQHIISSEVFSARDYMASKESR